MVSIRPDTYDVNTYAEFNIGWIETFDRSTIDTISVSPRVSTDRQAVHGYSWDIVQQRECTRIARNYGIRNILTHDVHGGESGRGGLPTLIQQLELAKLRGRSAVMRWSLDRVIRPQLRTNRSNELRRLETLASYGVPIITAMPLTASVSELRRAMARLIADYKRERGEPYAPIPHFDRQAILLIQQHKNAGLSYRAIARELNQAGIPTAKGKRWSEKQVWQNWERFGDYSPDALAMMELQRGVTEGLTLPHK